MSLVILLIALGLVGLVLFVSLPAATLAHSIRTTGPLLMFVAAAALALAGRFGLAMGLVIGGIGLRRRMKTATAFSSVGDEPRSVVRSAALEMELDHGSGEMDGLVLAGRHEGKALSELDRAALMELHDDVRDDGESSALLEAYLDRRLPGWRENGEAEADTGEARPLRTGTMREEEAHEVLGLEPGASTEAIRAAHRRLMKSAHPDAGGSTFLAAKINEAKDVLLRGHDSGS
ncbi:DnaJ domain-containing protein [Rhizobiaceae bacterium]|nr:DnaJ domain-containing protein [Rhizobiaceae bacterium]